MKGWVVLKRTVEIGRFRAKSDSGKEYTIVEFQDFLSARTHDNPYGEVAGLKELRTTTGLFVNFINDNTFKIVTTGEILHRI